MGTVHVFIRCFQALDSSELKGFLESLFFNVPLEDVHGQWIMHGLGGTKRPHTLWAKRRMLNCDDLIVVRSLIPFPIPDHPDQHSEALVFDNRNFWSGLQAGYAPDCRQEEYRFSYSSID